MDQKLLREREAKCVQENPPGCTAGCPVHVDVRGMIAAVRQGDYVAGLALFHRIIPFPGIISRICDQPCREGCQRNKLDDPIAVRALEQACVDHHYKPASYAIIQPQKHGTKVAVVGAGLSGLTVAVELARKGYQITVFEAGPILGGRILTVDELVLPRSLIAADMAIFDRLPVEFHLNTAIGKHSCPSLETLCEEFAAVYLGTGSPQEWEAQLGRDAQDQLTIDPLTLATSHPQIFAGGSLRRDGQPYSPIFSVCDGKIAAISIDRLRQNASLTANREKEGPYRSTLYTNLKDVMPQPITMMTDSSAGYTEQETLQEAQRCLQCECRECVKSCEYLAHYRSYPKRYVREVYNNLSIVMGIHHANKMINSCSLCGLCAQICPNSLDMGEICHEARQQMVKKGKMPPSAHDFAMRDMRFSTSEVFMLARHQPGHGSSNAVFYPGCQLAGSKPHYVHQLYDFLCSKLDGGVGLMLGCCGAPATWAGQEELFSQTLQQTEQNWRSLGSPTVITACPTCFRIFQQKLPHIPVEMVWTTLDTIGLPAGAGGGLGSHKLAIHDSCMTRHDSGLHQSVRSMISKLGQEWEELPRGREHTVCCGYGGLMLYANRDLAHQAINRHITESECDYVVYCAMCRDNFASQGKRAVHVLDLLFGSDYEQLANMPGPGLSNRQENRARLRNSLLQDVWGEPVEEQQSAVKVMIPDSVQQILEDRMILVSDIVQVINHAEKTGRKLKSQDTGHYLAYFQPASVTYWVEYSPAGEGYTVHNAYSHRIEISG